jgi:hypothetical protein
MATVVTGNTTGTNTSTGSTLTNGVVPYDLFSRLKQFPIIYDNVQNVNRLGNKDYTIINTIKANVQYTQWKITPRYQYRPDSIAYLFYGVVELWWVISGYNNFFNGPEDFYVNRVIQIPSPDGVLAVLT